LSPNGDLTVNGTAFKENVDAATIDHFIQQQVATGMVDANRIYLVGWSNGSSMAFLYGANRSNIAAAAVYSAPDPFGALEDPCQQIPASGAPADRGHVRLFAAGLPTFQVVTSCDAICGTNPNGDPNNLVANTVGASNHATWPVRQTPQMLQFLQQHPLSSRPKP
jgi:pimeloyl-ACP methyl ester carboxylesterase